MAKFFNITGVNKVLGKLKATSTVLSVEVGARLMMAGLFVQRESMKIVPVDTGNLKGTASTRNVGGIGWATDIVVAYSAEYAVMVHENLTARHKPGKRAKFLESIIREKRKEILAIVRG